MGLTPLPLSYRRGAWGEAFAALIVIVLISTSAFAASVNTGVTAGNFLKMGAGVRASALGGAFIAVADDPYAVYWNPAGLSQLRSFEFSSTYSSWLANTNYTNIGVVLPVARSTIGVLVNTVNIGPMEEATLANPSGSGKIFSPTKSSVAVAFSQRILPGFSLGGSVKYLSEDIFNNVTKGYGIDLGAMWRWREFIFGFNARNILGSLGSRIVANNFGLGISYRLDPFLLALDGNLPNDNKPFINFGIGYNSEDVLFYRIGYTGRNEENAQGNISAGIGYNYKNFKFDYSFTPYGDLGLVHKVSIGLYPFGQFSPKIKKVMLTPSKVVIEKGKKMKFVAEGINRRDDILGIRPIWLIEGDIGVIDKDGIFAAQKIGKGRLTILLKVPKDVIKTKIVTTEESAAPIDPLDRLTDSAYIEVIPTKK